MDRTLRYMTPLGALVAAVALTVLVLLAYVGTLGAGFVYDDKIQILLNKWITSAAYLPEIFSTHSFGFSEKGYQAISYRPMVFVVYMAEHALFGLENPGGWHLVNVILHAANSFMVFLTVGLFLNDDWGRPKEVGDEGEGGRKEAPSGWLPPFAAAAVFALHPINAEAVAWVGCIPELFYTLLGLSAFFLYILSSRRRYAEHEDSSALLRYGARLASVLLFFVAALTKETAVLLPALFFIYDFLKEERRLLRPHEAARRYGLYVIFGTAYIALRAWALGGEVTPAQRMHDWLTGFQFLLNSIVLLAKDLYMIVLPVGVHPLQLLDPVLSPSEPRALVSIIVLLAIPVVLYILRKRVHPLLIFAVFFIVIPLLPTLYAPAISRTPYADRYMYLPSVGYALMIALSVRGLLRLKVRPWAVRAMLAVMLVIYGPWAAVKAGAWKDDVSLWSSVLEGSEDNYLAIHSLGAISFNRGNTDEAVRLLERSLEVNLSNPHPDHTVVLSTRKVLATAYERKGLVDRAVREYTLVLSEEPDNLIANYNIAGLLARKGRYADSVAFYRKALTLARSPWQFADIYRGLGDSLSALGMRGEAAASYREALKYSPGEPVIMKRLDEAIGAGGLTK